MLTERSDLVLLLILVKVWLKFRFSTGFLHINTRYQLILQRVHLASPQSVI